MTAVPLWSPPALWRPRAGPWWRLPALFTGKFQRGSDGKLRRGTDGKMRTHDPASPSPCCCAPLECGCTDVTPANYVLTFSGVTICGGGGCFVICTSGVCDPAITANQIGSAQISGDPNVTVTLPTTVSVACSWDLQQTGASSTLTVNEYTTIGASRCTGPASTGTLATTFTVSITAGVMAVSIITARIDTSPFPTSGTLHAYYVFDASYSLGGLCAGPITIPNGYASTDCGRYDSTHNIVTAGYGGSVTVTAA